MQQRLSYAVPTRSIDTSRMVPGGHGVREDLPRHDAVPAPLPTLHGSRRRLALNAALQALIDEQVEIALVADRDGQAALQCKVEAGVVARLRCRHASTSRDAVLVL